ncbi:hypothetical protein RRG08_017347 [Elysia crispata]|uniref:Uncharacterized protein n=1 Tax=Elysia crispata TaxID=231223 RepID=A0AAE1E1R5_9GAST|nr:hypothetical protein RRG08_017347 [Elysia crispata]
MNRVGAVLISDRFALIAGLSFVAVAECAVGIGWRAVMDRSFKHGVLGREGLAQRHGRQIEQANSCEAWGSSPGHSDTISESVALGQELPYTITPRLYASRLERVKQQQEPTAHPN